jgi:polyketide cyclase/dehydrase/lipid transport protein
MLKKLLIGLIAIVAVFAVVVALQPSEYRISRSAMVAASASDVFAQVNDFHNWQAWSPWAKLDPAAKTTFEGSPAGQGAVFAWSGNDKVGEGRMTLTESRPGKLVRIKTDFVKPFVGTSASEFAFKPEGNQTAVTWSTSGQHNFISKAICMFMSMDKMLGGDMERGLAQMKSLAEAARK